MNPQDLLSKARQATEAAYAPYSNYQVGAALLCSDGTVFKGCNVENASYGLTTCAERTALFSAVATGQTHFSAIAITASTDPAPFPCGACRQVLAEFCDPSFPIYVASAAAPEGFYTTTLGDLLPFAFDLAKESDGPAADIA